LTTRYLLRPRNWFILYNEVMWGGRAGVAAKAASISAPDKIKKRLQSVNEARYIGLELETAV
jgi:hypothetical protein